MAKLVEILARELIRWPDCNHGKGETKAVTQDTGGEINTLDEGGSADKDQFLRSVWSGAVWTWGGLVLEVAEDHRTAIITRAEWQAAVDALYPKLVVAEEWDGVGLPPVGTRCEFYPGTPRGEWCWSENLASETLVDVIAHYSPLADGDLVAVFSYGDDHEGRDAGQAVAMCFRPIRTPEQIEKARREAEANELLKGFIEYRDSNPSHGSTARVMIEYMQAIGYRKQEQK